MVSKTNIGGLENQSPGSIQSPSDPNGSLAPRGGKSDNDKVEDGGNTAAAGGQSRQQMKKQLNLLKDSPATEPAPEERRTSPKSWTPGRNLNRAEVATAGPTTVAAVQELRQAGPRVLASSSKRTQADNSIHSTPDGDGVYVLAVMTITLGCVAAVLGVGYCVHSPNCPSSPYSTSSTPTFQSAKLAFRSPTDHQPTVHNRSVSEGREDGKGGRDSAVGPKDQRFQRPTSLAGIKGPHSINRMESLIDLEPDEEEEEDDMIYECPGLAPPGEMVVTNPFFLSDGFQDLEEDNFPPCPINVNNNIKHGNINSNNNNFNANKQAFINSEITH